MGQRLVQTVGGDGGIEPGMQGCAELSRNHNQPGESGRIPQRNDGLTACRGGGGPERLFFSADGDEMAIGRWAGPTIGFEDLEVDLHRTISDRHARWPRQAQLSQNKFNERSGAARHFTRQP